ncbi:hypothetical protein, partial [Paramuribaculum intestinale]|uniref:hypothetical protein n=1 Tax=Paramuribaculum intestinale TaxID=2094151 RepID=UPI0025AA20C0
MGLASPARRIFVDEQQQATHRGSGSSTKKPSVPLGSPHQGAAARAMAGLTKVARSPTIPDSCPAGWPAAIASDPSDFSSGWVGAIRAAERAGRQYPRFG